MDSPHFSYIRSERGFVFPALWLLRSFARMACAKFAPWAPSEFCPPDARDEASFRIGVLAPGEVDGVRAE